VAVIVWKDKLIEVRKDKEAELDKKCKDTILGRFSCDIDGVTYYFSNDTEAQANFEKCDRNLEKGRISTITWTAYDTSDNVVRLTFDVVTFEPLYIAQSTHIQANIIKYRDDLMPRVAAAQTIEEIQAITWED
jgi:YHS domain-containing protein